MIREDYLISLEKLNMVFIIIIVHSYYIIANTFFFFFFLVHAVCVCRVHVIFKFLAKVETLYVCVVCVLACVAVLGHRFHQWCNARGR